MISALGEGIMTIADGPEMPSINDFLPDPFVFQGTPFAINRIILVRILATVIMLLVLGITASRAKLIPGRWQGAVEWLIEFVRDNIVYQVMGELRGKRYVPMITTVFCTLLVFNLCGIIPGFNIAASASITLPLVFAMWCFCQYWIAGIREKGLGHFLRDEIFPKGVPAPIYILLSRDEAAVLANAIDTRRNWVGEKADDALPRIGVSATVDSTMIRFMECRGEGHIALTVTEAGRLASWLHDMADGRWRDHNGYVPEVVK